MKRQPLSDLHAMLGRIERAFDAERLNEICNDPSIYPWVRGNAEGPLDLSDVVANPANICLLGEQGAQLYVHLQPGLLEVHTSVLENGRGAWSLAFVRAALHWIFTHTDCVEIITRVPHGNRPALALAKRIDGQFELTNPNGWIMDGKIVPADIYSLRIQDWMKSAPGLEERGAWFHDRIEAEYGRHGMAEPPHPDDPVHDRYVGAACEMMLGDQPDKGVIFYNRFSAMSGYEPVKIIDFDPLTIDVRDAILIVKDDDFWMPICRKAA